MKENIIRFQPRESWLIKDKNGIIRMYKYYPLDEQGNLKKGGMALANDKVEQICSELGDKPVKAYWHRAIEIVNEIDIINGQ